MTDINDRFSSAEEAGERFAHTPIWNPADMPRDWGGSIHTGDGVFVAKCRACDELAYSYGPIPRYASIGEHERTHGLDVPGINVGMLP